MEGSAEKTQRQAADTSSELDELTYIDAWPAATRKREPRRTVWDAVSSAGARRMLREAYRLARLKDHTTVSDVARAPLSEDYSSHYVGPSAARRKRIRELLRQSNLARLLPGGFAALPDIYAAASPLTLGLLKMLEPTNCESLMRFLAVNLEWYLNPRDERVNPLFFHGLNPVSLTALAWFIFFGTVPWLHDAWILLSLVPAIGVTIAANLKGDGSAARDLNRDPEINALELYLYLRDAWADPEE